MSRINLRLTQSSLTLALVVVLSTSVSAQSPSHASGCWPSAIVRDEFRRLEVVAEPVQTDSDSEPVPPKMILDTVSFDGPIHLSSSAQESLGQEIKSLPLDPEGRRLQEIEEVGIRGRWQDEGFFKAQVATRLRLLTSDSTEQHFAMEIHVEEGERYKLGAVEFGSDDIKQDQGLYFPEHTLRDAVALRPGDVFRADDIRKSLDDLHRLYSSSGYTDAVVSPEMDLDEENSTIELRLVIAKGMQYRIREVRVVGLDSVVTADFLAAFPSGEIFNLSRVREMIRKCADRLPLGASESDVGMTYDVDNRTVDLVFDFFTCSAPANE